MITSLRAELLLKLLLLLIGIQFAISEDICSGETSWKCPEGKCISVSWVCDADNDCGDNSDEINCGPSAGCPSGKWKCTNGDCVLRETLCDKKNDCGDFSDEIACASPQEIEIYLEASAKSRRSLEDSRIHEAKSNLQKWLIRRRMNGTTTNKWGHHLARIIVALFLSDKNISPRNKTYEDMSYELTIQLLSRLSEDKKVLNNELAIYIHALLVSCIDPRNFYGHDLLSQLRAHVEDSEYDVNPFDFLVLCNSGDTMTSKDIEKISELYDSQHRPFWIDNQAMATLALACISARSNILIDERILIDMSQELKKHQFRNGTVDNLKTTGLVTQALIATNSYKRDFDFDAVIKMFIRSQNSDGSFGSFLNSYYILPVLSNTSLLNITSEHCKRPKMNEEEEALNAFLRFRGQRISTQYSVWVENDLELKKTWTLKVPINSSLYDIIEMAYKLDPRQRVVYNVVDGKPYVSSLNGLEDDIEKNLFWFIYIKTSGKQPQRVEESPVDVKIRPSQELILWYKKGKWIRQSRSRPSTVVVSEETVSEFPEIDEIELD